jgi:hypothetical protein
MGGGKNCPGALTHRLGMGPGGCVANIRFSLYFLFHFVFLAYYSVIPEHFSILINYVKEEKA